MKDNIFQRNPKKTLIFITLAFFLLAIQAAEIYIKNFEKNTATYVEKQGVKRHIVMREHRPESVTRFYPDSTSEQKKLSQKQYLLRMDKNGFIYPSEIHEDPDLKVVFLGGSTTECLLVDEGERFPYLVGRLLESDNIKVNSYNGGVSGNTSMHSLNILINKVIPLHPDIVIMMHNINDLATLVYEGSYWNNNPTRRLVSITGEPGFLGSLLSGSKKLLESIFPNLIAKIRSAKNSFIMNYQGINLGDEWRHVRNKQLQINTDLIKNQFKKSLLMFVAISRVQGFIPVLMTQVRRSSEQESPETDDFKYSSLFKEFNQIIRNIGDEQNVLVIDLDKFIPHSEQNLYDSMHFTPEGSALVAEIVANSIKENILKASKFSSGK